MHASLSVTAIELPPLKDQDLQTTVYLHRLYHVFRLLNGQAKPIKVVEHEPRFVIKYLLFHRQANMNGVTPDRRQTVFRQSTLVMVRSFVQFIVKQLQGYPSIREPLNQVVLMGAKDLNLPSPRIVGALVILRPIYGVLFRHNTIVSVIAPFVLPLTILIVVTNPYSVTK